MHVIEERVRVCGVDEVIFDGGEESGGGDDGHDAAVQVLDILRTCLTQYLTPLVGKK